MPATMRLRDTLADRREEIQRAAAESGAHVVRVFGSVMRGEEGDDEHALDPSDRCRRGQVEIDLLAPPRTADSVVRRVEHAGLRAAEVRSRHIPFQTHRTSPRRAAAGSRSP